MSEFPIVQGDTLPALTSTLTDGTGTPIVLTGASVRLRMRNVDSATLVVDAPATVIDANAGTVRYDWQAGDSATAGLFYAEWRVTFASGGRLTVPNEVPIFVRNRASLETLPSVTSACLREIRQRIGSTEPPTDIDLSSWLEEFEGNVDKVVLKVLEGRLALLLSKPAKYTIEGDSSFDFTPNLQALRAEVAALRNETGAVGLSVGQLVKTWNR